MLFSRDINSGHLIIAISVVYFALASYAIFFSAFLPLTGIYVRVLYLMAGVTVDIDCDFRSSMSWHKTRITSIL